MPFSSQSSFLQSGSNAHSRTLVLLSTKEAADLLRCSPKTLEVDRCRRRWRVPFLRRGKSILYDRSAVIKWLADQNHTEITEG